jgi:hypothetical protein
MLWTSWNSLFGSESLSLLPLLVDLVVVESEARVACSARVSSCIKEIEIHPALLEALLNSVHPFCIGMLETINGFDSSGEVELDGTSAGRGGMCDLLSAGDDVNDNIVLKKGFLSLGGMHLIRGIVASRDKERPLVLEDDEWLTQYLNGRTLPNTGPLLAVVQRINCNSVEVNHNSVEEGLWMNPMMMMIFMMHKG